MTAQEAEEAEGKAEFLSSITFMSEQKQKEIGNLLLLISSPMGGWIYTQTAYLNWMNPRPFAEQLLPQCSYKP